MKLACTLSRVHVLVHLAGVYVQKTQQILSSMRSTRGVSAVGLQNPFAAQLKGAIGKRGEQRAGGGLVEALNAKLGLS